MPILFHRDRVSHFAHIPKCAGTSIEDYLISQGVKTFFLDRSYKHSKGGANWNASSPQHVDGWALSKLFSPSLIDTCFGVCRRPEDRLISAFKFQLRHQYIDRSLSLSEFVKTQLKKHALSVGFLDNHFLPQVYFLLPNKDYKIFRLEDGLGEIKSFIDSNVLGAELNNPMPHNNASPVSHTDDPKFRLDQEARQIIQRIYKDDFDTFGYPIAN